MKVTQRSHYVWEYYLKTWAKSGLLYCSFNGESPQKVSTDNVAIKRFFYELAPFNEFEKEFLIRLIDKSMPAYIVSSLLDYIDSIESYFQKQGNKPGAYKSLNIQKGENLMTADENRNIIFLDKLKRGEIDYCTKDENRITFYAFIAMQYLRTKRIYDDLANIKELNVKSIITPYRRIMSFNLANYLCQHNHHSILLRNTTTQEFITSSQPVINTDVDYSTLDRHTDSLEFYYPISTNLAVLITNKNHFDNVSIAELELNDVDFYNRKIINASQMQVYCSNAIALDRYIQTS